ncbi:hypothetical protein N7520_007213 [Penicillium odoratum]|uniref:uncharacterized protein n=1 Tax=Penicillium odoratum TaxID=1167516 RepID=UPI0025495063|nr:uncharacterized protein N7520_007213 [Penicillium odoratum]KAJ5760057.1 hypothetical protein N7520_007213 [Penicillium odoratum]
MDNMQSNHPVETEAAQDKRTQLEDLITQAAAKDAIKDHNTASELYSQATELQAELNGELSPENANLLYAYGKSLYNVAVSKSDVLGSKVAGEQPQAQYNKALSADTGSAKSSGTGKNLVQDAISSAMTKNPLSAPSENVQSEAPQSKSLFQFSGDENFVDSDEEEEEDGEAEDEEEDDDFANAFEVLDLARILYLKKLEIAEESNGKSTQLSTEVKHIKERLADTYDLQAEISLEAERFSDAVTDLRTALDLRNSLFPFEDPSVAECHFKLSLALEFASVPREDEVEEKGKKEKNVDEEMRKEAAVQMEHAIESCRVRMAHEEKKLETDKDMDEDKVTASKRKIANVKEIIADMEQRLIDLQRSPDSVGQGDKENEAFLKGILGQIVGQSATDQKARLDSASKEATDLSSLVRRKPATGGASRSTASKRSAEDDPSESDSKRTRVDDYSSAS